MTATCPTSETDIDIVPIGAVQAAIFAPIHAASFDEAWSESALARLLKADAARAVGAVAGYERRPLGFVLAFAAAGEAEILTIAVTETSRRRGIGDKLLRALKMSLSEEGIERLFLEVAADHSAAQGLYRRHGFVETGRRRGYYQRPGEPAIDALSLAISLPPAKPNQHMPPSPTVQ